MGRKRKPIAVHSAETVRQFFARSDCLDRMVLRPLSHIAPNWEACWDDDRYAQEPSSFAGDLNIVIEAIATAPRSQRYHDHEDRLAECVVTHLKWPIQKKDGKWVGADYQAILEQGSFSDVSQRELLAAAAGRVHAALDYGQIEFDQMEEGHMTMLSGLMAIIIFHRYNDGSSVMVEDEEAVGPVESGLGVVLGTTV